MTADLASFIVGRLSEYTGIPAASIDVTQTFEAIGLQSADAVVLAAELEEFLAREVDVDILLRCPTLGAVLAELADATEHDGGPTDRS